MSIIFPDDIKNLQTEVRAYADELNSAYLASSRPLADGDEAKQWGIFYGSCVVYAAIDVGWTNTTGALYDQGLALLKTLDGWRARFAGEAVNVPPQPADPSAQSSSVKLLETATTLVLVVGGTYLLVKLLQRV